MMNNRAQDIQERSYAFALKIVRLTRTFPRDGEGKAIAAQLVRSATSIPANLFEESGGVTRKDFTQFMSIAKKSAIETGFWIRLSHDLDFLRPDQFAEYADECDQIVRILSRVILNAKR